MGWTTNLNCCRISSINSTKVLICFLSKYQTKRASFCESIFNMLQTRCKHVWIICESKIQDSHMEK